MGKRNRKMAEPYYEEPCFPSLDAALAAVKADGAEYFIDYNRAPDGAVTGYKFFRPSRSFAGQWGSVVLFRLHATDSRGQWQRAVWLLEYDGRDERAVPVSSLAVSS